MFSILKTDSILFHPSENRAGPSNLGNVISQILLCKQITPDFNQEELCSIAKDSQEIAMLLSELQEFMPQHETYLGECVVFFSSSITLLYLSFFSFNCLGFYIILCMILGKRLFTVHTKHITFSILIKKFLQARRIILLNFFFVFFPWKKLFLHIFFRKVIENFSNFSYGKYYSFVMEILYNS